MTVKQSWSERKLWYELMGENDFCTIMKYILLTRESHDIDLRFMETQKLQKPDV